MEYAIAKVSTKGQIVIPQSLRKNIRAGDEFIMVKDDGRIILKSMKSLASEMKNDLIFARRTDEALERVSHGKGTRVHFDDFIEEMKTW